MQHTDRTLGAVQKDQEEIQNTLDNLPRAIADVVFEANTDSGGTQSEGVFWSFYIFPEYRQETDHQHNESRGACKLSSDGFKNWWVVPNNSEECTEDPVGPFTTLAEALIVSVVLNRTNGIPTVAKERTSAED